MLHVYVLWDYEIFYNFNAYGHEICKHYIQNIKAELAFKTDAPFKKKSFWMNCFSNKMRFFFYFLHIFYTQLLTTSIKEKKKTQKTFFVILKGQLN